MPTKTISGSYPSGYYLQPTFQELDVAPTATVGGTGVTTSSAQPSTIKNLGAVTGSQNGITLNDGGSVINGSSGNTSASIYGGHAIYASGANASVTNSGAVGSTATPDTYYPQYNKELASVVLNAGGSVTNNETGTIANGISISGAAGSVTNDGAIGSPYHYAYYLESGGNSYFLKKSDPAIVLAQGGTITNGAASNTSATIAGFVYSQSGTTSVNNFGSIASLSASNATIVNGSATSTTASIGDARLFGTSGKITNFGRLPSFSFDHAFTLIEEGTGTIGTSKSSGGGGTLELAGDAGAGSIRNLGVALTQFANVVVDAGATWTFAGTNNLVPAGAATTVTLRNKGTLTNTGTLTLGGRTISSGSFDNASGATLDLAGNYSITIVPGTMPATFSNAGTLRKTAGAGTSIIDAGSQSLTDTGSIDVETGTLVLTGTSVSVSGTIQGAGAIAFGAGSATLSSTSVTTSDVLLAGAGAHVTLAKSLSYAGTFSQGSGTELTIDNTLSLTLTGSAIFTRGTIDGPGQLNTTGNSTIAGVTVDDRASWINSGTVTETGQLTLSTVRVSGFANMHGGVFDLAGNVGITATTATRFYNLGLLAKTAGGSGAVEVAITNKGTIEAGSGTLDLQGAISGTGKLQIDSGESLKLESAVSSGQTVLFQGVGDRLILTDAQEFAGTLLGFGGTDKLDLTQFGTGSTLNYAANAKGTGGTLTVNNGSLIANIALSGQYTKAGFGAASDGNGGSFVSYRPPAGTATSAQLGAASAPMSTLGHVLFDAAFAGGGIATSGTGPDPHAASAATMAATSAFVPKAAS